MATHSSILARRIPGTEEPDGLQSTEPQRVRHDWVTNSFTFTLLITAVLGVEGLPLWLSGKESACIAGDLGCIPGLGRSPGEGKGSPLQYSGLENPIDCIVHGVAKRYTRLSDFHLHLGVETLSVYRPHRSSEEEKITYVWGLAQNCYIFFLFCCNVRAGMCVLVGSLRITAYPTDTRCTRTFV